LGIRFYRIYQEEFFVKRPNSIAVFLIVIATLFSAGFACNQAESSSTPNNQSSSTAPTPAAAADISGTYDITGTNENGGGTYKGALEIIKRGDVYQFKWDTAGKKYDGVGVQTDNSAAVAFTEGENGTGCGVVLYKVGADGSLDGKAGYWGNNSSESEKATRTSGTGIDGEYSITGKTPAGKDYKGTLSVKPVGSGYAFAWKTGTTLEGFGIKQGDKVAVGIGGKKCGFVAYDIASDGNLNGRWGGYGSTSVGTETAKKK
jgi:hypothetical protein